MKDDIIVEVHEKETPQPTAVARRYNQYGSKGPPIPLKKGRPPSEVRAAARLAFEERIPTLCEIADGKVKYTVETATHSGKVVEVSVVPSVSERIRAIEVLGKHAGLTSTAILDKDGEEQDLPDQINPYDLSNLTVQQMMQLEQILLQAAGKKAQEGEETISAEVVDG